MSAGSVVTLFTWLNAAAEGAAAFQSMQSSLYQIQQKRLASGKVLGVEELLAEMDEGDIEAAAQRAKLVAARLSRIASEQP